MLVVLIFSLSRNTKQLNTRNFWLFQPKNVQNVNLKLLEKPLEFEKERLLSETIEPRDKVALAELETQHNEILSSSNSRTSSN